MKKLLFTGASGFLGNNILPSLRKEYLVTTVGLTDRDDIKANLANGPIALSDRYDLVLHAAGKAHTVPKTEAERKVFFDVNYGGTVHLCESLEQSGVPDTIVFISTVAVYGCDFGELIDENHPLQGTTPYALSKIQAEKYLTSWCESNHVNLTILRPSLMAGHNAPGNLGAMVNGIKNGFYVNIAGGKAKKSILMAEDIARLLPILEHRNGVYNVSDSYHPTFGELSESVARQLGKRKPVNIPNWMAVGLAKIGDLLGSRAPFNSYKLSKMKESLTFSNSKICNDLAWEPLDVLKNFKI